ncbi:MAG: hypothetical protein FWF86_06815, partial [Clostridia bacterium]|nr:hypothetical protein [Clostridia bacterium]
MTKANPLHVVRKNSKVRTSFHVMGVLNVVIGILVVFPVLYCFLTSFMSYSEMTAYPPKLFPASFAYLDNYLEMMQKTLIIRYMFNSLVMAAGGTLLRLWIASMAAFS